MPNHSDDQGLSTFETFIALQIQSIAVMLEVMKVVPLLD
jgi:hypothetical protein